MTNTGCKLICAELFPPLGLYNLLHRLNVWYESLWEGEKPDELSEDREEKNDVA